MTTPITRTFTCVGHLHGSCGVAHESIEAALRCFIADQRALARVGLCSDRMLTSSTGPLTDIDLIAIDVALEKMFTAE